MAEISLQVLEGLERGRVYDGLPTPVTIGRENENTVRLNDDRISRFHAKIQEADGKIILTDLQSTNGTRVNGYPVSLRVLRPGDQIWIGRCLLVYGRPVRLTPQRPALDGDLDRTRPSTLAVTPVPASDPSDEFLSGQLALFPDGIPELPEDMSPVHVAQLSDLLTYVHALVVQISHVSVEAETPDVVDAAGNPTRGMLVPQRQWHSLLEMEMQLAKRIRSLTEPGA